jgi:hypothetical protein
LVAIFRTTYTIMKKGLSLFILLALTISLHGQGLSRKDLKYKPKNLDEAIEQLDKIIDAKDKEEIKHLTEDDFSIGQHFALAMWIRNEWGLWKEKELFHFFDSLGVDHPDNMSGIILRCYHRHLNGKDIDLSGQIAETKEANEKYRQEILEAEKITLEMFESLNVSDTVRIDFLTERNQKIPQTYFIYKNGPTEEQKDRYTICSILGSVVSKKIATAPKQYFVDIRLLDLCGHETLKFWYPYNKSKVGDIISYDIQGKNISRR